MGLKFLHSGKYGDLIYALWTIKALGGGEIWFNTTEGSLVPTGGYEFCRPLLESLPFITGSKKVQFTANFVNNRGQKMFCRQNPDYPDLLILDNAWYWGTQPETYHWINRYAYTFGVTVNASSPIIHISPKPHSEGSFGEVSKPIVVQFSNLYRCVTDSAYEKLLARKDVVRVQEGSCRNMLELVELIASSRFFVGNQSLGAAIAQALQHPRLIENYPVEPDAQPIGTNGITFNNLDEGLEQMEACMKQAN